MVKYSDIFVPGGFPRHTYNPRVDLQHLGASEFMRQLDPQAIISSVGPDTEIERLRQRIAELEALLRDGRDCASELAFGNTRRWDTKNRVTLIQRIDAALGRKD